MGDFRGGGPKRFGGRGGGFGGPRRDGGGRRGEFGQRPGGDRDRGPVTMHDAICDQCKKPCQVPFRPSGDKPVYCSNCFEGKRDSGGSDRGRDRFAPRSFEGQRPSPRQDFAPNNSGANVDELKRQIDTLNGKIDKLIKTVETLVNAKPPVTWEKLKEDVQASKVAKEPVKEPAKAKKPAKKVSKK